MALARGIEGRVTGKAGAAPAASPIEVRRRKEELKRGSTRERNGLSREDMVELGAGNSTGCKLHSGRFQTKFSSILTVHNSKFHIET